MAWPPVVVIVGPTAAGKSEVAIEVARLLGGEIVNADAFQVYRGMDIGTAKVRPADRRGIAHHLLDILDVTQELSVAQYQEAGREVLLRLGSRSVPAVVVGGSGLYVRALLDDLRFPGSDPAIRRRWEARLAELGPDQLHAILAERDPEAAAHILPTNGRRIVRALEVGELTGEPFTAQLPAAGPPLVPHVSVGLDLPRDLLDERIRARVGRMFEAGLVEEVRALLTAGPARRSHRQPGVGLSPGDRPPRRPARPGPGRGGHRPGDQALRASPAALVPPRPTHDVAGRDGHPVVHSLADRIPDGRACP